jgi:hypothetical protein
MEFAKSKTAISLIALFLIATVAVIIPLPTVTAEDRYYTSYVYVADGAGARGVGVNEMVLLVAWTADMPPNVGEIQGVVQSPTGRAGWADIQVKVTDPDGEEELLTLPFSDSVGATYTTYYPTKVGTYQIQAIFPYTVKEIMATIQSGGSFFQEGDVFVYSAAESPVDTFEVYEEPTEPWLEAPLPNDFWTRPISDASREWYVLQGNWLAGAANVWPHGAAGGTVSNFAYGTGPESAHILWSKPFYIGGLMDERFGNINFATAHYQGVSFSPTVVLDGKIHYTPRYTHAGSQGWRIIDLYTGETLFNDWDATCPNSGQIYLYESGNQHGGFAYLWETGGGGFFFGGGGSPVEVPEIIFVSNTFQNSSLGLPHRRGGYITVNRTETPVSLGTVWKMIDAYTMKTVCYIANVSTSGTEVYGKDGSLLRYNTVNLGTPTDPNYYCTVWNASAGTMVASHSGTGSWQWRPAGGDFGAEDPYFGAPFFSSFPMDYNIVHDGNQMWWQNFSIPDMSGGSIRCIREGEYMIVGAAGENTKEVSENGWMMKISLEEENKGSQLWRREFTPPYVDLDKNITVAGMFTGGFSLMGVYPEEGVMVFGESKQLKIWVYDLETGQELWATEEGEIPQYWFYSDNVMAHDGKVLIYGGYAGTMLAYNATTGERLWEYNAENVGEESPYGNYPISVMAVADNKIYFQAWEHSYTHPIIRGPCLRCVNLTDGTEIWSVLDFGTGGCIADGILLNSNSQDNMIYAFGRGPSATTVAASPEISVHGNGVMIKGTVTDQTASGRRNTNDIVDFTLKGTPAISDEDMSAWMEYMFMQQAKPTDAEGVEVVLETLDPNGNFYEIGRTTSDINGNYGFMWLPEVPGEYQIFARFEGSASYGPSSATTYVGVAEAPQPTPTPTPTPAPMTDTYVLGIGAGAIIAIIVVGLILILMMRKR